MEVAAAGGQQPQQRPAALEAAAEVGGEAAAAGVQVPWPGRSQQQVPARGRAAPAPGAPGGRGRAAAAPTQTAQGVVEGQRAGTPQPRPRLLPPPASPACAVARVQPARPQAGPGRRTLTAAAGGPPARPARAAEAAAAAAAMRRRPLRQVGRPPALLPAPPPRWRCRPDPPTCPGWTSQRKSRTGAGSPGGKARQQRRRRRSGPCRRSRRRARGLRPPWRA